MAHVAREIKVNVNTNRFIEILQECEEFAVDALETISESTYPSQRRKDFDIRIKIGGTRHAKDDFFKLEKNGYYLIQTIVFDSSEEYNLYLQDFRSVSIQPLEIPKFKVR